jgi:hypothetical protein
MAFGQHFVWIMDCFALKFILSQDGNKPAILRLQMRFMCWDMIIEHRNDVCLTNAEYVSWLGTDLCYDPLLKEYVQQVAALCCCSPAPTSMPIAPEYQPYFFGLQVNLPCKLYPPLPTPQPPAHNATVDSVLCSLQHLY